MAYDSLRWKDDPGAKSVLCNKCKNYLGFAKCKAFPERIPKEIILMDKKLLEIVSCNGKDKIHFENK